MASTLVGRAAPGGLPSRAELPALLALTVAPVPLTHALHRGATASRIVRDLAIDPSHVSFGCYAAANWLVLALLFWMIGTDRLRALGMRWRPTAGRVGWAVGAFVVGLFVYAVTQALAAALGLPGVRGMDYATPGAAEVVLLVLFTVLTAPLSEEILFRVVWIGGLGGHVSKRVAALLSILAFAAIHYPYFGAGGVLFISVWAILPSWLFIRYGDLTAPLLLHVLNNGFAYVLVPLYLR